MVCFLFPVGLWRGIVLKLVTNRKFQPCVPPAQLQPSCLLFTVPSSSSSVSPRQFEFQEESSDKDSGLGGLHSVLLFPSAEYDHQLRCLGSGHHFWDAFPGYSLLGRFPRVLGSGVGWGGAHR